MMADDRDPILQNLFTEAVNELEGEEFVDQVLAKTRKQKHKLLAVGAGITLVLVAIVWLFTLPALELVQLITQVLSTTLIELGEGWLAWILTPVNNIAGLLVLSVKALRMAWKRMVGPPYAF